MGLFEELIGENQQFLGYKPGKAISQKRRESGMDAVITKTLDNLKNKGKSK